MGIDWEDRKSIKRDDFDDNESRFGGEDGAGDEELFRCFGPVVVKKLGDCAIGAKGESVEDGQGKPSVTVLVNMDEVLPDDLPAAQARTPRGGW